jgi:hypothetical protein
MYTIQDPEPLSRLTNLSSLGLVGCPLDSHTLAPLSSLTELILLDVTELSEIPELPNLKMLEVEMGPVRIHENNTGLTDLKGWVNPDRNSEFLTNFQNLRILDCDYIPLSTLATLTNLVNLWVRGVEMPNGDRVHPFQLEDELRRKLPNTGIRSHCQEWCFQK